MCERRVQLDVPKLDAVAVGILDVRLLVEDDVAHAQHEVVQVANLAMAAGGQGKERSLRVRTRTHNRMGKRRSGERAFGHDTRRLAVLAQCARSRAEVHTHLLFPAGSIFFKKVHLDEYLARRQTRH